MLMTSNRFLRTVLLVDAATCLAAGMLMAFGAGALSDLLNMPRGLLLEAGIVLFPVAAFIAVVATRARLSAPLVWIVIAGNVLWVLGSASVLASGELRPNAMGSLFVAVQAAAVIVLTTLEIRGVRQFAGAESAFRTGSAPSR
jgi:hypothetical protein